MRHIISKPNLRFFLIPILVLLIFVRCDDDETPFPNANINAILSLDTQLGNMLVDTYKFVDGYGIGGLIIYRKEQNTFLAFDRACRYEASKSCTVDDDEFTGVLVCSCCDSEYWMVLDMEGTYKQGPAKANLKQYNCYYDGANTIRVTN